MEEKKLDDYIEEFFIVKNEVDKYKKIADEDNKEIKKLMQNAKITEYMTENGLVAKMGVQKRESFNEEKLLTKLKELDVRTPIKTIEVVDMDELENVIYNGQLNAGEITDCKQVKEILTLKVIERKEK